MSALEDYQVDRSEVYARIFKGAQLTDTNRTIGLISSCVSVPRFWRCQATSVRANLVGRPFLRDAHYNFFLVAISVGPHPFPFRTRTLSPPEPMILDKGKVGRCQDFLTPRPVNTVRGLLLGCRAFDVPAGLCDYARARYSCPG